MVIEYKWGKVVGEEKGDVGGDGGRVRKMMRS